VNKRLAAMQVHCGCVDNVNYNVLAGFNKPDDKLQIFDFEESNGAHTTSGVFNTPISGLLHINGVSNRDIVVVGTMGGTIHLWDTKT
jgi:hypothetical protein